MEDVAALFTNLEIEKGKYFLKEGQFCERLSFVQSGFFRVYAYEGDREITQWIATAGFLLLT